MIGKLLQLVRAPGFVRPVEYTDPNTGQRVTVRTSPRYTVVTLDSLELYFDRESGRFDGAGMMSLGDPTGLNGLQADRIRRSAALRGSGGHPLGQ